MNMSDSLQKLKIWDKNLGLLHWWRIRDQLCRMKLCKLAVKLTWCHYVMRQKSSSSVMSCVHKGSHSLSNTLVHNTSPDWINLSACGSMRGLFLLTIYDWIVQDHRSLHVWTLFLGKMNLFFFLSSMLITVAVLRLPHSDWIPSQGLLRMYHWTFQS